MELHQRRYERGMTEVRPRTSEVPAKHERWYDRGMTKKRPKNSDALRENTPLNYFQRLHGC